MPALDHSRFVPASCWPTPWQRLILQAVIGREEDRGAAWDELCAGADLERLDPASGALLSLAWTAVVQDRATAPDRERIKGTWRHQWVLDQTLRTTLCEVVTRLAGHGIDVAILDTTASALLDYPEGMLRPWAGLTLAVRARDDARAGEFLDEMGWNEQRESARAGTRHWAREGAAALTLQVPVFPESVPDARVWDRMVPVVVDGVRTLVLPRPERLIHLAYHGIRWMPATPLLAFVDAAMIVKLMDSESRRSLATTARQWRMTTSVMRILCFLHGLGVDGARASMDAMGHHPWNLGETIESRLRDRRNGLLLSHLRDWLRARRLRRAGSL